MLATPPRPTIDQRTLKTIEIAAALFTRRNPGLGLESDDLVQELTVHVLQRSTAFDHDAGAWSTFVKCVVRTKLTSIYRAQNTLRKSVVHAAMPLSTLQKDNGACPKNVDSVKQPSQLGRRIRSSVESSDLRRDVDRALDKLPDDLRDLAQQLAESQSLHAAARALGISRSTAYRRLNQLREILCQFDLHEYL